VKRLHHGNPGIVADRVYAWGKEREEIVDMNEIRSKFLDRLRHRSSANRIIDRTKHRKHLVNVRSDCLIRNNESMDIVARRSKEPQFVLKDKVFPTPLLVPVMSDKNFHLIRQSVYLEFPHVLTRLRALKARTGARMRLAM
jgi:hypothetical protein